MNSGLTVDRAIRALAFGVFGIPLVVAMGSWPQGGSAQAESQDAPSHSYTASALTFKLDSDEPPDRAVMAEAIDILMHEACTELGERARDLEGGRVRLFKGGMYGFPGETFGWTRYVEVRILVRDRPTTIPRAWRASGHTLHYYVGGGERPGVAALKDVSHRLCGAMPVHTDGSYSFIDIPAADVVAQQR